MRIVRVMGLSYFIFILFFFSSTIVFSQADKNGSVEANKNIDNIVDGIGSQLEKNSQFFDTTDDYTEINQNALDSKDIYFKKNKIQKADFKNLRTETYSNYIGVVQKNILNKTSKFQIYAGFASSVNDTYYRTLGAQTNLSYHLNEKYGVTLFGYFLSSSPRSEIKDIENNQGLTVDSLVYLKSYYGASAYFNNIYGKMSLFNEKIVPFEVFFNLGCGYVGTQSSSQNLGVHGGVGALFTLDTNRGIKFDLNWLFYNSKNILNETSTSNSILLTVGYSYFLGG